MGLYLRKAMVKTSLQANQEIRNASEQSEKPNLGEEEKFKETKKIKIQKTNCKIFMNY